MAETAKKKSTARKTAPKTVILTTESPTAPPTHHDVQLLAYQQWENRGRQNGDDAQDWLQAESQLKG